MKRLGICDPVYDPSCLRQGDEDCISQQVDAPFLMSGVCYVPCDTSGLGERRRASDESGVITLFMRRGTIGLQQSYTPQGARGLAATLIKLPDELDGKLATQAAAAINKARGK